MGNRIRLLPPNVVSRIAAGEVIARPSSAVKELVENSLDAGATRIAIELEAGGKRLIRVIDDGCGMTRDDAILCIERHATSKIASETDLIDIHTLGFRGEALASLAAVSRMKILTRAATEQTGTVVEIEGGTIKSVQEAGMPAGTTVEVRDLFFNVPARKAF
ncbi:MAG TPA: DNA mismatch repair protein MutL, partial [Proteobacteria bacterium]|nr:DNA mismatch repair protein MutL [Pseudomonadota bacterium]